MKNILIDVSGKIDSLYVQAIRDIKEITDSQNISFFIIGALARDIIMEYFYEIKAPRITMDIDLGIKVSGWSRFDKLINALEKSGKFRRLKEKHKIVYKNIIIDIVPFGGISGKDEKIIWPPQKEVVISVTGFNEVYDYSTLAKLQSNPDLEIKIPTLPGLAILKLFAWKDSYPYRPRDAEDLLFIMEKYEIAVNLEELYESELSILESEDFDVQMSGIVLLGKEMGKICTKKTLKYLREIINEETSENSNFNLVKHMIYSSKDDFDKILLFLKKLKKGILYQKNL